MWSAKGACSRRKPATASFSPRIDGKPNSRSRPGASRTTSRTYARTSGHAAIHARLRASPSGLVCGTMRKRKASKSGPGRSRCASPSRIKSRNVSGPTGSSAWLPARRLTAFGPVPNLTPQSGRPPSLSPSSWNAATSACLSQAARMRSRTSAWVWNEDGARSASEESMVTYERLKV